MKIEEITKVILKSMELHIDLVILLIHYEAKNNQFRYQSIKSSLSKQVALQFEMQVWTI